MPALALALAISIAFATPLASDLQLFGGTSAKAADARAQRDALAQQQLRKQLWSSQARLRGALASLQRQVRLSGGAAEPFEYAGTNAEKDDARFDAVHTDGRYSDDLFSRDLRSGEVQSRAEMSVEQYLEHVSRSQPVVLLGGASSARPFETLERILQRVPDPASSSGWLLEAATRLCGAQLVPLYRFYDGEAEWAGLRQVRLVLLVLVLVLVLMVLVLLVVLVLTHSFCPRCGRRSSPSSLAAGSAPRWQYTTGASRGTAQRSSRPSVCTSLPTLRATCCRGRGQQGKLAVLLLLVRWRTLGRACSSGRRAPARGCTSTRSARAFGCSCSAVRSVGSITHKDPCCEFLK